MNCTGLFECICAISEEELYKAPLPDEGESIVHLGTGSMQESSNRLPFKDTENEVTVSSAIRKDFSGGPNLRSYVEQK